MMDPKDLAGRPIGTLFSNHTDIEQMSEAPNRKIHHRRAHSDTFFRFPDDILLDDVVAGAADDFNFSSLDFPPLSPSDNNMAAAVNSSSSEGITVCRPPGGGTHFRSLSVGADLFEGLGLSFDAGETQEKKGGGYSHRHSNSMDGGSETTSFEGLVVLDDAKKPLGPDKLAELSLIDPKRAKRILANRQSAARSKERKIRYTSELEKKVQTLQTEATTLSAQVTMLQRDTTGLTAENKELKLRLQAMEQQAQLRDALNETLREEVQRLKLVTGQHPSMNNGGYGQSLPRYPQTLHDFGNHQGLSVQHQHPLQQHQQLQMQDNSITNHPSPDGQLQPSFMDFS